VTGIWVLLAGLLACVLGAVGFFFGCATAIGGGSGGRASDWLMNGSLVLGVGGLAVMAAGFIMTLVQVLRR
jgi:hypothetical protein